VKRPLLPYLIAVFMLTAWAVVRAHPASAVRLEFDSAAHLLKVDVMHDTKNPAAHYIQTVSVRLNGREIVKQEFASQEDSIHQTAAYKIIDAKPGDNIEVMTVCNVFGKKKESIRL
jgi:hypothetical protein